MNTLILYASKHGAAREIARRIAESMNGAALHDLKQAGLPPLARFDCVIIGSSLYAGMIRKEAKEYLTQNADALGEKRLGLFLCGMDGGREKEYFEGNFSPDILASAKSAAFLGGIFDPKKAGAAGRLIMKAAAGQSGYADTIDDGKIKGFAEVMGA